VPAVAQAKACGGGLGNDISRLTDFDGEEICIFGPISQIMPRRKLARAPLRLAARNLSPDEQNPGGAWRIIEAEWFRIKDRGTARSSLLK